MRVWPLSRGGSSPRLPPILLPGGRAPWRWAVVLAAALGGCATVRFGPGATREDRRAVRLAWKRKVGATDYLHPVATPGGVLGVAYCDVRSIDAGGREERKLPTCDPAFISRDADEKLRARQESARAAETAAAQAQTDLERMNALLPGLMAKNVLLNETAAAPAPDGTLYVGSNDHHLYAIAPDGAVRWKLEIGGTLSSPAAGPDGTVYVASDQGSVQAVSAAGAPLWKATTAEGRPSMPLLGPDLSVHVQVGPRRVVGLSCDGSPRWTVEVDADVEGTPVVGGDGVLYVATDEGAVAIGPDGQRRWTADLRRNEPTGPGSSRVHGVTSGPALARDGTVYLGASRALVALAADGSERWRFPLAGDHDVDGEPVVAADGTVLFASDEPRLLAVTRDGALRWSLGLEREGGYGALSIGHDGRLYLGGGSELALSALSDQWLYAVDTGIPGDPQWGDPTARWRRLGGSTARCEPEPSVVEPSPPEPEKGGRRRPVKRTRSPRKGAP